MTLRSKHVQVHACCQGPQINGGRVLDLFPVPVRLALCDLEAPGWGEPPAVLVLFLFLFVFFTFWFFACSLWFWVFCVCFLSCTETAQWIMYRSNSVLFCLTLSR